MWADSTRSKYKRQGQCYSGFRLGRRETAEQWIKEGKNAINWTRLPDRNCGANALRATIVDNWQEPSGESRLKTRCSP